MKRRFLISVALAMGLCGAAGQAQAGCVTGAIVGGIAGHVLGHHGLAGAAAGCAVGSIHRRQYYGGYRRPAYGAYGDSYHRPYSY